MRVRNTLFVALLATAALALALPALAGGGGEVSPRPDTAPERSASRHAADKEYALATTIQPGKVEFAVHEEGSLTATVKKKAEFAANEELTFAVTFKNESNHGVTVRSREYLGSTTFGEYKYQVKNLQTGAVWEVRTCRDPRPRILLPAFVGTVVIGAGASRCTTVIVPHCGHGFFLAGVKPRPPQSDQGSALVVGPEAEPPHQFTLPAGKYRLTVDFGALDAAPASTEFTVLAETTAKPGAK